MFGLVGIVDLFSRRSLPLLALILELIDAIRSDAPERQQIK
jgi:hypothetical protein